MDKSTAFSAGVAASGLAIAASIAPPVAALVDDCLQPAEVLCTERMPEPRHVGDKEVEQDAGMQSPAGSTGSVVITPLTGSISFEGHSPVLHRRAQVDMSETLGPPLTLLSG
jgi:hypothetical protein